MNKNEKIKSRIETLLILTTKEYGQETIDSIFNLVVILSEGQSVEFAKWKDERFHKLSNGFYELFGEEWKLDAKEYDLDEIYSIYLKEKGV